MDSAEVGVLEQTHEICFSRLLKRKNCVTLKPQVRLIQINSHYKSAGCKAYKIGQMKSNYVHDYLEILCDFTDKALEGKLADQQFGALLIFADFTVQILGFCC